ncbi:DUF2971 domain-containing protein, partial [Aeromonas hydrophila]
METLYKYYGSMPTNYLDNPTIRLTPPVQLNDPFEKIIPVEILDYISENEDLYNQICAYSNIANEKKVKTKHLLNTSINSCGVASFSETQRNLLMWAHYANNHKGICIGYSTNLFQDKDTSGEF